ncbi:hypothetical protein [Croceiramulus getboli]|nr:hypothetical protein P8624_01130 [Flavobacteriaceae bacterium YJPT1-3]
MKSFLVVLIILLTLTACKTEQQSEANSETPPAEEAWTADSFTDSIALAHGYDQWSKVQEIRFTFNVDRGDNHFERSWIWQPKTDDVTLMSAQDTVRYNRKDMDSTAIATDKGFINDKFWLLAPYQLVWDENIEVTVQDTATAPMSKEVMTKVTTVYTGDGGYTPGDAYDYFIDDDKVVREWIYRRGNVSEFSMVTTWEDYEDLNGLQISKTHRAPEDAVKLYFTGIEVMKEE